MCGRYSISDPNHVAYIAEQVGVVIDPFPCMFNIAPTENVPVLYQYHDKPALSFMRWWLVPSWSSGPSSKYAMFNARAESLSKSRAYQKPFKQQRAIIPASSFIEWKTEPEGKQPYLIELESGPMAFAGLWDLWTDGSEIIYSCSIITTEATKSFSQIHKRMPVMLKADEFECWMNNSTPTESLQKMLDPHLPGELTHTLISKLVGNSTNKQPIEPIGIKIHIS